MSGLAFTAKGWQADLAGWGGRDVNTGRLPALSRLRARGQALAFLSLTLHRAQRCGSHYKYIASKLKASAYLCMAKPHNWRCWDSCRNPLLDLWKRLQRTNRGLRNAKTALMCLSATQALNVLDVVPVKCWRWLILMPLKILINGSHYEEWRHSNFPLASLALNETPTSVNVNLGFEEPKLRCLVFVRSLRKLERHLKMETCWQIMNSALA